MSKILKKDLKNEQGVVILHNALTYFKNKPEDLLNYLKEEGDYTKKLSPSTRSEVIHFVTEAYLLRETDVYNLTEARQLALLGEDEFQLIEIDSNIYFYELQKDFILNSYKYLMYFPNIRVDIDELGEEHFELILNSGLLEYVEEHSRLDLRLLENSINNKIQDLRISSFLTIFMKDIQNFNEIDVEKLKLQVEELENTNAFKNVKEVSDLINHKFKPLDKTK